MILFIVFILFIVLIVSFFLILSFLDKEHNKNCEQWKKEQIENGMSEKEADFILMYNPDYALW